jgi:phage-related protein
MPALEVIFYQEAEGKTPALMDGLPQKARLKCLARVKRLEDLGHDLRRPEADFLRDGVYELRASYQGTHYRMLYFFHARTAVVLTHGILKEREVPAREIEKAIRAKSAFELDPTVHTFKPGR